MLASSPDAPTMATVQGWKNGFSDLMVFLCDCTDITLLLTMIHVQFHNSDKPLGLEKQDRSEACHHEAAG
jgi:hypothetical protein